VDTTNILFVCTGSFNGLEELVRRRTGTRGLGFGATISKSDESKKRVAADGAHRGSHQIWMIPEFMGRLPIIVAADELDVDDLMAILWKPKNALASQYDACSISRALSCVFTEGTACAAWPRRPRAGKSGARGLRPFWKK